MRDARAARLTHIDDVLHTCFDFFVELSVLCLVAHYGGFELQREG
jgi:hypothetical protein